jgi:hypothetical protein
MSDIKFKNILIIYLKFLENRLIINTNYHKYI